MTSHGPVGGKKDVQALQGYLRSCVAAAAGNGSMMPGPWDQWTGRERTAVNIERAAMLARGDTGVPPSMLRMAGLA